MESFKLSDNKDYNEVLKFCEQKVREGQIKVAQSVLSQLNQTQVPRKFRVELARLCRRVGLHVKGLQILKKIIFDQIPGESEATARERCEYAVLLSRVGLVDEALIILDQISPNNHNELFLYKGFCLTSKWNYHEAAIAFQNFLKINDDLYLKKVAKVNLISALIAERRVREALDLVTELITSDLSPTDKRLLGNCLELKAQVLFYNNSIDEAESLLSQAFKIFEDSNSYDKVLIAKWKSVIQAHKNKDVEPLIRFKKTAEQWTHWESMREADFHILKLQLSQDRFDYLYYGTPYASYRQRICEELQLEPSPYFHLGDVDSVPLSLLTGKYGPSGEYQLSLKLHKLFTALVDDFYTPITMGSIFSSVYTDEFFDIESSPNRVRQILSRFNKWIKSQKLNVDLLNCRSGYKLTINKGLSLYLSKDKFVLSNEFRSFQILKSKLKLNKQFTILEALNKDLNMSRSEFHRTIRWAIKTRKITKLGTGKLTQYRFTENSESPLQLLKRVG